MCHSSVAYLPGRVEGFDSDLVESEKEARQIPGNLLADELRGSEPHLWEQVSPNLLPAVESGVKRSRPLQVPGLRFRP